MARISGDLLWVEQGGDGALLGGILEDVHGEDGGDGESRKADPESKLYGSRLYVKQSRKPRVDSQALPSHGHLLSLTGLILKSLESIVTHKSPGLSAIHMSDRWRLAISSSKISRLCARNSAQQRYCRQLSAGSPCRGSDQKRSNATIYVSK